MRSDTGANDCGVLQGGVMDRKMAQYYAKVVAEQASRRFVWASLLGDNDSRKALKISTEQAYRPVAPLD